MDTGDENVPEYVNHLKNVVKNENINIEHVIITHWHHDHIGGVKDIYNFLDRKLKIVTLYLKKIYYAYSINFFNS